MAIASFEEFSMGLEGECSSRLFNHTLDLMIFVFFLYIHIYAIYIYFKHTYTRCWDEPFFRSVDMFFFWKKNETTPINQPWTECCGNITIFFSSPNYEGKDDERKKKTK